MHIVRLHQYIEQKNIQTGMTVIDTKPWRYICIPTMIGCPVRCTFCPSSQPGQPYKGVVASECIETMIRDGIMHPVLPDHQSQLIEVSLTGEGEAVMNTKNVLTAIKNVMQTHHIDRVRVACSGLGMDRMVDFVKELSAMIPVRMLFSLHHPDNNVRKKYIPHTMDLDTIRQYLQQCTPYCEEISLNMVYFPEFEYSVELAQQLQAWINNFPWKIQIQPLLTGKAMTDSEKSAWTQHKLRWSKILQDLGINTVAFEKISAEMQTHFYDLTYTLK